MLFSSWLPNLRHTLYALSLAGSLAFGLPAQAQSETSVLLSAVPLASASVVGASVGGSEGAIWMPIALSAGTAELVVEAVSASADGLSYLVRRVGDGASGLIEVSGNAAGAASVAVGSVIQAVAIGSGVVLSAAGEVLAFIPNAVGQALLHSEKL